MVRLKIDFISDVMCPWCVVGLGGLEAALAEVAPDDIAADVHFQPFELNPQMVPEGEQTAAHIAAKYGATPEQSAANRENIRARAAEVGFTMAFGPDSRIWNSFDAHRLLHWAGTLGATEQHALKMALFTAHFTDGQAMADHSVLADVAAKAGLDRAAAAGVLASDAYAADVRAAEATWHRNGIQAVPTVIVNDRYVIAGGQPAAIYAKALRQIADEAGREMA